MAQNTFDLGLGLIGRDMTVGVYIAATNPPLRRDLPHPTRFLRPCMGKGRQFLSLGKIQPERHRTVDRKHVAIVDPFDPHDPADNRATETGAVDEKIACQSFAVIQNQRDDIAGFVTSRPRDQRVDHLDPLRLGS